MKQVAVLIFARPGEPEVLTSTVVSTLAEIEAAADALPLKEKKKLLEFLATRVNGEEKKKAPIEFAKFAGAVGLPEDPLVWQRRVRGEWR